MAIIAAEFSARERAVLFVLLAEGRSLANPELAERIGFRLQGARRRRLNELGLVTSSRLGRAYAHELTEAGWRWCTSELAAGAAGRGADTRGGTGIERALYAVIGGIGRSLETSGLNLADILVQLAGPGRERRPGPRRTEYQGTHRGKPRDIGWAPASRTAPVEMAGQS